MLPNDLNQLIGDIVCETIVLIKNYSNLLTNDLSIDRYVIQLIIGQITHRIWLTNYGIWKNYNCQLHSKEKMIYLLSIEKNCTQWQMTNDKWYWPFFYHSLFFCFSYNWMNWVKVFKVYLELIVIKYCLVHFSNWICTVILTELSQL